MTTTGAKLETGAVAFLDALGMKGVWAHTSPHKVIGSWKKVMKLMNDKRDAWNAEGRQQFECSVSAFSDTVMVTMKGDKPHILVLNMADFIMWPFIVGIELGIFFRGVISSGTFYKSDNLLIGPAVDEAAGWYSKPQWIGVSTTPSASIGVQRALEGNFRAMEVLSHYQVPMKKGTDSSWALRWPMDETLEKYVEKKEISIQAWLLDAETNRPINPSDKQKVDNTIKFIDRFTGRGTN